MDDKLKAFTDSHKDEFNEELLPEGHLDRFEKRLKGTSRLDVKIVSLIAFAAAACVALLLIYQLPAGLINNDESSYTCEVGQEVEELQFYYHMQMNGVLAKMEEMYDRDRTAGAEELLKETKNVQIASFRFEEEILPTLPCTEDVISIVNQHYGNSLNSMKMMMEHMENVVEMNVTN